MDSIYLQPADWIEHDVDFNYVIDAFGRTHNGDVARVRINGFCPYIYLRASPGETLTSVENAINFRSSNKVRRIKITLEHKLDAMRGFSNLQSTKVWKLQFKSLWDYKSTIRVLNEHFSIGNRKIDSTDIYESDLPPLIRFFHERDILPASAIRFPETVHNTGDECNVDMFYQTNYDEVEPATTINIPLYVAGYDLEVLPSQVPQFPVSSNPNDAIMQAGISFRWNDNLLETVARYVFIVGKCTPSTDPSVQFISCKNEKELLLRFVECIQTENPDAITGYNTFGFDDGYIADRAEYLGIDLNFGRTEKLNWWRDRVKTERKTFELASGKFAVRYINMAGRLNADLYLSIRREQNLESYKLDNVANTFLRDKVLNTVIITGEKTQYEIHTKSTRGLFVGNQIRFDIVSNTSNPYRDGQKLHVKAVYPKKFIIELSADNCLFDDLSEKDLKQLEWSFAKDDMDIHTLARCLVGTPDERSLVAKYCIQDCDLVLTAMAKLDTLVNARGMADVCRVPIQYIFLRGQGIKIYSAVVYNASKRNQIIMNQESSEEDTSYEGAIVLPPKIGMYLDQPIPVLDFNSLYPSNMIAYNLSPDTLAYVKTYDMNGRLLKFEGIKPEGFKVDEIKYDIKNDKGESIGQTTCGYVQPNDDSNTVGLLPLTLDILLKKRKETRKLMESTEDDAQKSVLNGLQLAYKVVANSVYGQCGSRTSPIRKLEVAACTTAAGRDRIQFAKSIVESQFGGEVIYGDTDSIFIKFPTKDLAESIKLGQEAADFITNAINRKPYRIEYEKTLYPFILFCRKRYVGMLYEDDPNAKPKRKSMGIALKRRDNAPIVKDIFGGALDILIEERNIQKAQRFVQEMLVDLMQNKMPLEKFIVTKQLRDDYKNPDQIAHAVLAKRMEERDPGNKPQVGDRLPYIYVQERKDQKKQGDKIEHVDYVRANNLKPDTEFYISNQIQNPVAQLFALAIEKLEGYKPKANYTVMYNDYIEDGLDDEEATLAVLKRKEKELEDIMFLGAQYLKKLKRGPMDAYIRR